MKKKYKEPVIEAKCIYCVNCLAASNDNWQVDPKSDGWGEWLP